MKPTLAAVLILLVCASLARGAEAQTAASPPAPRKPEGWLYIAGNRFTLEQAVADAALDKFGGVAGPGFGIIATESETRKLTVKGSKPNVKNAVRQLQRAGATFYLCERDMKRAGLGAKDLLPGVKVEPGWNKEELRKASMGADSSAPELRRIRRLCS